MKILVASFLLTLVPATEAGFTGLWFRVDSRSDDPDTQIQAAVRGFVEKATRGRATADDVDPKVMRRLKGTVELFVQYAEELDIELSPKELIIDDGGPRLRIFYLDELKHERQLPNGTRLETRAVRIGNQITIEGESSEGAKIFETYVLADDGDQLTLTARLEDDQLKAPLVIKSIYTRAD